MNNLLPRKEEIKEDDRKNNFEGTRGKIEYLLHPERKLKDIQELVLRYGKAKQPSKLLYWECVGLLRSMEYGMKGPSSISWYYGGRYSQSFRIYVEALINSTKKLSLARDEDQSCDAALYLRNRPEVSKISDCPELMRKLCRQVYKKRDSFKRFLWIGTTELTQ